MVSERNSPDEGGEPIPPADVDPGEMDGEVAFWAKLALTAFPFFLVLLFLLLEWWVRGRS